MHRDAPGCGNRYLQLDDEPARRSRPSGERSSDAASVLGHDDPVLAENFSRHIDLISRRHLVLVNMLRPPNADPLFNSESIVAVDQIYQQLGGHMIWQSLLETERNLKQCGVGFSFLDNEHL